MALGYRVVLHFNSYVSTDQSVSPECRPLSTWVLCALELFDIITSWSAFEHYLVISVISVLLLSLSYTSL